MSSSTSTCLSTIMWRRSVKPAFPHGLYLTSERRFRMTWPGLLRALLSDPVWTTATPFLLECRKATSTSYSALRTCSSKNKIRPHITCLEGAPLASDTFASVLQAGNACDQDSINRHAEILQTVRTSIRAKTNPLFAVTRSTSH